MKHTLNFRKEFILNFLKNRKNNNTVNDDAYSEVFGSSSFDGGFDGVSGNSAPEDSITQDNVRRAGSHTDCNYWQAAESFRIYLVFNFAAMFVLPLMVSH